MYLEQLQVRNVRAITQSDLKLSSSINVFTGINGSGKTSLLESIYLLGVGRSFRSNQIKTIINDNANELSVFGKLSKPGSHSLGISRDKQGNFKVRINNEDQKKLSSLAHYLPVLVITPDSYKLLTAGPQYRRQFLDLSVFHVEHDFSAHWQRYNRILKQRNAQLKRCNQYQDIAIWDKEFAHLADTLNNQRNTEFLRLKSHLEDIQGIFLPQYRVQYTYSSGWDTGSNRTYSEQLQDCFDADRRYGYSSIGAHKADIKLTIDSLPVQDVLSRGEQKMLVNAMHLAQAKRLSEDLNKHCLLLVDDLPSELDTNKQQLLINELSKLQKVQLFITTITELDADLEEFGEKGVLSSVFHVEQGSVSITEV
jgi:DNA replication and repair protein RecF